MLDLLTKAVPNTEAAAFIRNKPIVSRQVYDRMLPEVQALSFTISGVERYDVLQRVRDMTAELPLGGDWNKIKRGIAAELSPWLGDEKAAKARAELILRHLGLQSYRVSQWEQVQRNTDVYPYLKYIATRDGKTRSSHQALHGVILPVDDPFWQGHMPPWEWGCRCQVIQVSQAQYDAQLAKDKDLPLDERKVLDEKARARLNDEGRFVHARRDSQDRLQPPQNFDVRTPQQKGNRGPGTVEDLRIPMEVLRDRYDDDIWQEFEGWAKKTDLPLMQKSVWSWLEDGVDATTSAATSAAAAIGTAGNVPVVLATGQAPVSQAITVATLKPAIRESAQEAIDAIDSVHGDGVLPASVVKTGRTRHLGTYHPVTHEIKIKEIGAWRELTMVHETGHFLHNAALGVPPMGIRSIPQIMERSMVAIRGSAAFDGLELQLANSLGVQSRKHLRYLLEDYELWARAYAQYIAERSGSAKLLDQVRRARLHHAERQWSREDFEPIGIAIDEMFIKLGWRK